MKRLTSLSLLLFSLTPLPAQENGIDQDLELVTYPSGEKVIVWYGHVGRSYFVQASIPTDHLNKWTWAPLIEGGDGNDISHEVNGTADKGFFRLQYTNQVPGPGENLDTADFDGDGISNKDEVEPGELLAPTNPLNLDTDGDGMPDGWERNHGLDPNDSADAANLFTGSSMTNIQAFNAGVQANPNATPTNKDGDSAEDVVDADPNDTYVDWEPAFEASYAIVELEQESYGVPSANSVETKVTRKASIGKYGRILYDVLVSHKEPEDEHFITVSTRTVRVWKNGTWSTDLSEQITPKYDNSGEIHKFSALRVCADYVIGNVDYSNDTDDYDPKTGGTRWNLEATNGTTTRIYSSADVGGNGTSVEGFSDQVASSPGGAFALVSGSKFNSGIAKWRGWYPPSGNATPTYIPGNGASSIQLSYEDNFIQAIEDGGSMVVKETGRTIISEGESEYALPDDAHAAWYHCICKVAKGNAGDSRLLVGATKINPNGTDYENGTTGLWIKNGGQVNAAQHAPSIGRVKAIAKNGVILGKGAIWRNGQAITLNQLVEYEKVSGPSSATRFTNLEGLAMNGEGAIVATADDQLNQGEGHKTLLALLPVEVAYIDPNDANWETILPEKRVFLKDEKLRIRVRISGTELSISKLEDMGFSDIYLKTSITRAGFSETPVSIRDRVCSVICSGGITEVRAELALSDLQSINLLPTGGVDDYANYSTLDYANGAASNFDDSQAFIDTMTAGGRGQPAGYANNKKNVTLSSNPPQSATDKTFFQAAGAEVISARFGSSVKLGMVMNQAEVFYFSGHGSPGTRAYGPGFLMSDEGEVDGLDLVNYWNDDLHIALIAGCSVVNVNNLNPDPGAYTPPTIGPNAGYYPGEFMNTLGPRYVLGYGASAPADIHGTSGIVTSFVNAYLAAPLDPFSPWAIANYNAHAWNATAIEKNTKFGHFEPITIFGVVVDYVWNNTPFADW